MALMEYVFELEGKKEEERKDAFLKLLEKNAYEYELEKFAEEQGINVTLELGKGDKEILLVCNYDSYHDSPGANNNASAVAVAIDVYRRLDDYKKKGLLNGKIKIIFFGNEEPTSSNFRGLMGSKEYVKAHQQDLSRAIAVISLKLCGSGDMIAVWPVNNDNKSSHALEIIKKVFEKLQKEHTTITRINAFTGCYESFVNTGIKDTFCLTAIRKEDKDNLKLYAESMPIEVGARNLLGIFFKNMKVQVPDIISNYRNLGDKSSYIDESSLRMMSDAVFNAIVNLDRKLSTNIEHF